MKNRAVFAGAACAALFVLAMAGCRNAQVGTGTAIAAPESRIDWPVFGGSAAQSRFFDYQAITPDNVGKLEIAWIYPVTDNIIYQFSPVVADGVMFVLAKNNALVALDAAT